MENEYRERKPNLDSNMGSGHRPSNPKESNIGRETLENLQGNVYREKPPVEKEPVGSRFTATNTATNTETSRKTADDQPKKEAGKTTKKSPRAPKRPNIIVQVLNGDILTRDFVLNNLTYIFFFLFLLLLVVSKGYYGKQLTKDIETLQTEVNANTAEYIENKAKLEELTTRYRLVEILERRGLKESLKPAKVIRIKRPEK
ncbi:MAG: FtsL-like putative cell division protein [Fluviicola sp.]|nr:FtsL-like putative cell division protein [Fluviicola sp.]